MEGLVSLTFNQSLKGADDSRIFEEFGNNIRIEQECAHSSTARPYSGFRSRSIGSLAKGDSAKNLDRLFGCRARLVKRSNSSIARMTTASLPCLVTTWERAR